MKTNDTKITADVSPLQTLLDLTQRFVELRNGGVKLPDLSSDLVRTETDVCSAGAGELIVTFYPSDAFLVFFAALARDFDFSLIKYSGHFESPDNFGSSLIISK